jgi:predicted nuclease of restriction endonuclease-like RecB superfamily
MWKKDYLKNKLKKLKKLYIKKELMLIRNKKSILYRYLLFNYK